MIFMYWGGVLYLFLRIPSCSSGFIQAFLDHYVDLYIGSMMYTSDKAQLIVGLAYRPSLDIHHVSYVNFVTKTVKMIFIAKHVK